jgi:hypothetical protein
LVLHEAHCFRNFRKCPHCAVLFEVHKLDGHIAEARGSMAELAAALDAGDAGRVRSALDHGGVSLLSWRDEQARTLLHLAAAAAADRWDLEEVLTTLLRMGADVDDEDQLGWTALHHAARGGSAAAVNALLAAGADVHRRGKLGSSALEAAIGDEARAALLMAGAELPGSAGSSRTASTGSSRAGSRGGSRAVSRQPSLSYDDGAAAAATDLSAGGDLFANFGRVVNITDPGSSAAAMSGGASNASGGRTAYVHPHPPLASRQPSSSRHAQRLRAMVQAQPQGQPPAGVT